MFLGLCINMLSLARWYINVNVFLIFIDNDSELDGTTSSNIYQLLDGSGFIKKRKVRKIIRFRHFGKDNEKDYWREQLMLFTPWRNEEEQLDNADVIQAAKDDMTIIMENSKPYYNSREEDDNILGAYINEIEGDLEEDSEGNVVQNDMEALMEEEEYTSSMLTGSRSHATAPDKILAPRLIEEIEYYRIMRSLNTKQRHIVMHILHCLKTDKLPFYIF